MVVSFFYTYHILLSILTILAILAIQSKRFSPNRYHISVLVLLGLSDIFWGYKNISFVESVLSNAQMGGRDANLAADIKTYSAALMALGCFSLFVGYKNFKVL